MMLVLNLTAAGEAKKIFLDVSDGITVKLISIS